MDLKTDRFTALLEGATSARVHLGLSAGDMAVHVAADPANLIDAEVAYLGEIDFRVTGEAEKTVILSQKMEWLLEWINPENWRNAPNLRWDIGLSPDVPMQVEINGGAGRCRFDLGRLNLTAVTINGGAGEMDIVLPPSEAAYNATVNGGAGEIEIEIAPGAAVNLTVRSGVGAVEIDTPPDSAARLDARLGLGDIQAGARFTRVSGGSGDLPVALHEVWETPGFAGAAHPINVRFEGGVGSLKIS